MSDTLQYTGVKTLEILQDAVNYNHFLEKELVQFIAPAKTALDFGAGIGEFAMRIKKQGIEVSCIEVDHNLQEHLRKNGLSVHQSVPENVQRIYSLNVLEHIEDDVATLKELYEKLSAGGKFFLYVPAFMCLYTDLDKQIGHFRRYTMKELVDKLKAAGFAIERAEYVDSIGFVCWFFMGKLPGNKETINPLMVKIFDRVVFPVSRVVDKLVKKILGKNLLVIATKN